MSAAVWSSGLCDCCAGPRGNPGFFCASLCCNFYAQGILLQDAGLVNSYVYPAVAYALLDALTGLTFPLLAFVSLRRSMVEATGKARSEGVCATYCISCCCYPCAMSQVHRDLYDRNYRFKQNDRLVNSILGVIEEKTPMPYARI
jgi:Cys-rich protein (TIGR01571 family)